MAVSVYFSFGVAAIEERAASDRQLSQRLEI